MEGYRIKEELETQGMDFEKIITNTNGSSITIKMKKLRSSSLKPEV